MSADLEGGGYSWSGNLGSLDVRALYDRLNTLRLSGVVELSDGEKSAQVTFIGGDPVETLGSDSREVRLWKRGTFRVVQRVPDLGGTLTDGVRLTGQLLDVRPRDLIRHCEDARLTADLEIERAGGERALVRFAHGRVERAEVNGRPELSALAMIDGWLDGKYTIALRPLFADDAPRTPPPQLRSGPAPGALFDFTAPVELSALDEIPAVQQARAAAAAPATPPPEPLPAPPGPSVSVDAGLDVIDRPTEERAPIPGEATAITRPLPPPSRPPDPDQTRGVRAPRKRWPWILVGTVGGLAVLGGVAWFVLPRLGVSLPGVQPAPVAPAPAPAPAPEPEKPAPAPQKTNKDKPVAVEKTAPREKPASERSPAVQRLIDKGRKLLVEGHSHTAFDTFKEAHKLAPRDPQIDLFERMAKGKTGRGELILDGGEVDVDGKKFKGGKKLKLPAGPHLVDGQEIQLGKGEKKHVGR